VPERARWISAADKAESLDVCFTPSLSPQSDAKCMCMCAEHQVKLATKEAREQPE